MTNTEAYASLQGRLTYPNGEVFFISAPRVRFVDPTKDAKLNIDEIQSFKPVAHLDMAGPVPHVDLRMEGQEPNPSVIYGVSRRSSYDGIIDLIAQIVLDPWITEVHTVTRLLKALGIDLEGDLTDWTAENIATKLKEKLA